MSSIEFSKTRDAELAWIDAILDIPESDKNMDVEKEDDTMNQEEEDGTAADGTAVAAPGKKLFLKY